jgi:hypothetical protein
MLMLKVSSFEPPIFCKDTRKPRVGQVQKRFKSLHLYRERPLEF